MVEGMGMRTKTKFAPTGAMSTEASQEFVDPFSRRKDGP